MNAAKELWNRLDEILQVEANPVDKTGIGKLNRLAKKGFPEINAISYEINHENSNIELVKELSVASLGEYRLAHNKKGARAEENPLIIICWGGVNYIIDGTHRVNSWISDNYSGSFSAIIITPNKGSGIE
jgi:hypothetical protein